jgi:hypothetical protein
MREGMAAPPPTETLASDGHSVDLLGDLLYHRASRCSYEKPSLAGRRWEDAALDGSGRYQH